MQHVSNQSDGRVESSIPDTPQHQALIPSSNLSNHRHDPYAFSRIGNQRFGAGSARQLSTPQISSRETSAPLVPWVPSLSVPPSYAPSLAAPSSYPPATAQPSRSSTPAQSLYTSSRLVPSFASSHAALSFPSTTSFASGPPSATDSALIAPPPANALHTVVAPVVSQAFPSTPHGPSAWVHACQFALPYTPFPGSDGQIRGLLLPPQSNYQPSTNTASPLPPPTNPDTSIGHGMRVPDQIPHREHIQEPTEEEIDKLYAFFYHDRGRLPPHAVSSYSSLAWALSEPGSSTSRNVHPPRASIGGQDADNRDRNQPAKGVEKSNAIGSQLAFPTQTAAPRSHLPSDLDQEAGPLPTMSSAVAPNSAGPVRPRKRKATAPSAGEAERVDAQAKQRNKRTTKGKGKAIEPESNPESEPESGSEGADGNAPVLAEESAEAIRSRKRRGRRKDGIHALYEEVARFIRVEPLETLSLDEVVQLAVDFLKTRWDMEQQNNEVRLLRDALTAAQSQPQPDKADKANESMPLELTILQEQLKIKAEESQRLAAALAAMTVKSRQHEEEAQRSAEEVRRKDEDLQRYIKEASRNAEEAQRSKTQARVYELQIRKYEVELHQSQGLAEQYCNQLAQKEGQFLATITELQRYQEHYPRP
ncbi:hypothetical protein EVG20_g6336 [Dentipellis fragilis]|uniref:Uncharacterized protein n=1 Tax=Dentipellis fragilis TaxID=205917 RepID=A0A4Y9YNL2_9AGAM|nr:hypothetical protein EVG20_g6336 [Dentipellis fragilis]